MPKSSNVLMANASEAAGNVTDKMTVVITLMRIHVLMAQDGHKQVVEMANLHAAMASACLGHGFVMTMMTVVTTLMKNLATVLPKPAVQTSLLVIISNVFHCDGNVMVILIAMMVLMKVDVPQRHLQFVQKISFAVTMEVASVVIGNVMEKTIVMMDQMRKDVLLLLTVLWISFLVMMEVNAFQALKSVTGYRTVRMGLMKVPVSVWLTVLLINSSVEVPQSVLKNPKSVIKIETVLMERMSNKVAISMNAWITMATVNKYVMI